MTENRLDVRDEDEPFDLIMSELDDIDEGDELVLVNSFEPEPLYNVLENRGFNYESSNDDGVWYVRIRHA